MNLSSGCFPGENTQIFLPVGKTVLLTNLRLSFPVGSDVRPSNGVRLSPDVLTF